MYISVLPEVDGGFLVERLRVFFTAERIRTTLLPLINQDSQVSLRLLDWLCVNYSKNRNIMCCGTDGVLRNIHNDYKLTLSVYRRSSFDPFRRKLRSTVRVDDDVYITTLAQCNFVYWAYEHGILDYAITNLSAIEADMNSFSHRHRLHLRELKKNGIKHRRSNLTETAHSDCRVYHKTSRVNFCIDA